MFPAQKRVPTQLRIVWILIPVIITGSIFFLVKNNPFFSQTTSSVTSREFQSQKLGIRFTYTAEDYGQKIIVEEVGTTVYIHPENIDRVHGQYVQVFQKNQEETLIQAIQRQLLTTKQQSACSVKNGTNQDGTPPNSGVAAVITFPLGTDANSDGLELRKNCPDQYSLTNGLSYFWTDTEHSTKFVFFSIGQYYIPGITSGTSWHTTLHFLAPENQNL